MKIFAVTNGRSESDFDLYGDMKSGGSNAHSGGAVIIANTLEEAKKLLNKAMVKADGYDVEERNLGTLEEIKLKKGIILFADGAC